MDRCCAVHDDEIILQQRSRLMDLLHRGHACGNNNGSASLTDMFQHL